MKKTTLYLSIGALAFALHSCGGGSESAPEATAEAPQSMYADKKVETDPMKNKGIGPVTSVELGEEVDAAMAEEGRLIYEEKCSACHKPTERYIGPAPKGIFDRRTPEWVMNMILNPEEMVANDPIAKDLLKEYLSPMANQSLTEDQARKILEYFRTL